MNFYEERLNHSAKLPRGTFTPRKSWWPSVGKVAPATSGEGVPDRDHTTADVAWSMTGYLITGMALYGGLGWLLDRWLGHDALFLPIGVLVGIALAITLVFARSAGSTATAVLMEEDRLMRADVAATEASRER